jgi:hypothetical protein
LSDLRIVMGGPSRSAFSPGVVSGCFVQHREVKVIALNCHESV